MRYIIHLPDDSSIPEDFINEPDVGDILVLHRDWIGNFAVKVVKVRGFYIDTEKVQH